MNAKKSKLTEPDARALLRDAEELYATKGKRVVHMDLKNEPISSAVLKSLVLGPTGNLRAPTLRLGRTLLVGFDEGVYKKVFEA